MRNLRLALLGLAAIAAILLGTNFLERALQPASGTGPAAPQEAAQEAAVPAEPAADTAPLSPPRRELEASLAKAPDYARFFTQLRAIFPGDYETIMNGLAQPGGDAKAPSPDAAMADAVSALRKSRGALAAQASDAALGRIFALQLEQMRALAAQNVHLCVAFLYGASSNGFLAFAAEHRPLVTNAALAGLDAMDKGRTDNVRRGAPNDGDFQRLDKALTERGMSRPEIEALLDGKTAQPPIADDRMCQAGQIYLETLSTLPPDTRARLYGLAVDLMAKS